MIDKEDSFTCVCPVGYYGTVCNLKDACVLSTPCLNGGTCINLQTENIVEELTEMKNKILKENNEISGFLKSDSSKLIPKNVNGHSKSKFSKSFIPENPQSLVSTYDCQCTPPYTGINCTIVDPCLLLGACLNGGVCTSRESRAVVSQLEAVCSCSEGYYGSKCQFFNPCLSNPCKNLGSCFINNPTQASNNLSTSIPQKISSSPRFLPTPQFSAIPQISPFPPSFSCKCLSGYYGPTCEQYNSCWSEPCLNNGTI